MHFRLLENGLDSLRFGLQFYYKYIKLEDKYAEDNPGYLKMGVISIHNTIELLSKKLLSEVNEILIYKDLEDESLLKSLGEQRRYTSFSIERDLIFSNANIKTINYTDCINRLAIVFDLSNNQKETLRTLGHLRNQVTHFGINNNQIDFFRVLIVINRSLKMITDFFYKELKFLGEEAELDTFYGDLEDILEEANYVVEAHWSMLYSENFEKINEIVEELLNNEKLKHFLETKDLQMYVNTGPHNESPDISICIKDNKNNDLVYIDTYHIPDSDLTLFLNRESGLIYFVIDHNAMLDEQKDLYIYKNFKNFHDADLLIDEIDYWDKLKFKFQKKKPKEQDEFTKKELDISNISSTITKAINEKLKNN